MAGCSAATSVWLSAVDAEGVELVARAAAAAHVPRAPIDRAAGDGRAGVDGRASRMTPEDRAALGVERVELVARARHRTDVDDAVRNRRRPGRLQDVLRVTRVRDRDIDPRVVCRRAPLDAELGPDERRPKQLPAGR